MIIDGKKIAENILQELIAERAQFGHLRLGVLMGLGDKATESFVRIKGRIAAELTIELMRKELLPSATTKEALTEIKELLRTTDGIIIQLPLPLGVNVEEVLQSLPPGQDPDALGREGKSLVTPPVVAAIQEILKKERVDIQGKRILVAGQGRLVGIPVAVWLRQEHLSFVIVEDSLGMVKEAPSADIIVLGTGSPGILKPSMIKSGVVILDAGTSEASGKIVGDADPSCAAKAALFTPVPGGIGPIAVMILFRNFLELIKRKGI